MEHQEQTLFHFSEDGAIALFEPRNPPGDSDGSPIVWAIDAAHAPLYYLPRDCPRVTFHAVESTADADVEHFLGHTTARIVVAIESAWLARVTNTKLFRYHLPADRFWLLDAGAGYHVSSHPVAPSRVDRIDDLPGALVAEGVELRITPSLWPLHDAVAASSLQFSMIRMRNASPRH